MKITLEIPDETFREVKARAALRENAVQQFVTEALEEKIRREASLGEAGQAPSWMRGFGALADLKQENRRIKSVIEEAFERVEPKDKT
jgi:hypothetical protein